MQDEIIDEDIPFTVCQNTVIQDSNLSYFAVGIFLYLKSKPKDWKVIVKHLQKRNNTSEYAVRNGLRELRDHGYIKWVRVQSGCIYYISAEGKYKNDIQHDEIQHADIQHDEVQHDIYIQNKESNKIKTKQTAAKNAVVQKQEEYLSLPEWQELSEYETEKTLWYITQRKEDHGKTIKNTSKAIKPILSAILELKAKGLSINDIMENIKDKNGCVYQTIRIGYFDNVFSRLKAQNNTNYYKNGNSYQQTETYTPKQPLNDDKNSKDYFSYRFNEDISVAFGYQECIELTNSIIEQKPEFEKVARTKALLEWLRVETKSQYNTKIKSEVLDIYKKGGYCE
jgi:hypothetical protein